MNMENENQTNEVNQTAEVPNEGAGTADTQPAGNVEGTKTLTQEEAQKMADAIVAKKLKGMPTKEEVQEYKEWKEAQKTEEQKRAERDAQSALQAKELEDTKKELAVYKRGVNSDEAEFVAYKVSKMEGDFETNLDAFLKENPKYLGGTKEEPQGATGLPTERIQSKTGSGVEAILKAKHPEVIVPDYFLI